MSEVSDRSTTFPPFSRLLHLIVVKVISPRTNHFSTVRDEVTYNQKGSTKVVTYNL